MRLVCLPILLATFLVSGCAVGAHTEGQPPASSSQGVSAPADSAPAGSTPATGDRTAQVQHVLDDFVAAARRGDRAAATALVSDRDQAFAGRAAVWVANLQRIGWSRLTWTAQTGQVPLSAERRAALGDDAWVQRVTVTWALPGESHPAQDELWLTVVDEPATGAGQEAATRLAGDGDGPTASTPTPIWLQQPVRLLRAGSALVLTDADDADAWLDQARATQHAVDDRIGRADRDRGGVLVVEVPQSRAVFERILGVAAGSYAAIAAAAWPMAADTSTAPVHVVVNPEASRQLSVLGRDVLLTHEAVHVATRSPGSPAPTWVAEGYADQIAYDAYPAGRVPAEQSVRDSVRAHGVPKDWPAEKDFAPNADDLDLSYDLAWTAADSIARAYGKDGLNRFYAALGTGDSVDEAAEEIGATEKELRKRWHRDLEDASRG